MNRCKGFADISEVLHPTELRIYIARHVDRDPERMAVQASAFMVGRHIGQAVRCLNAEFLEDFHAITSKKTPCDRMDRMAFYLFGSPTRTRTTDPLINSQLLYQLSYRGKVGHP